MVHRNSPAVRVVDSRVGVVGVVIDVVGDDDGNDVVVNCDLDPVDYCMSICISIIIISSGCSRSGIGSNGSERSNNKDSKHCKNKFRWFCISTLKCTYLSLYTLRDY
jgi:hypothetical protein